MRCTIDRLRILTAEIEMLLKIVKIIIQMVAIIEIFRVEILKMVVPPPPPNRQNPDFNWPPPQRQSEYRSSPSRRQNTALNVKYVQKKSPETIEAVVEVRII